MRKETFVRFSSVRDVDISDIQFNFAPGNMTTLMVFLSLTTVAFRIAEGIVPSATIRSPYIQISGPSEASNGRSLDYDDPYYQRTAPKRSYIIYEDFRHIPTNNNDENQQQGFGTPRSWHLQFNRELQRQHQPPPMMSNNLYGQQSVYSNLIQIVDDPSQRKYFGPYDGKAYFDNNKRFPTFLKPAEVPKYDVVYPFESQRDNIYYNAKLPEKFPTPFHPNSNFQFRDPPPVDNSRQDVGLFRTHTINYPPIKNNDVPQQRSDRPCNFIQLNDKGFPTGNELCGRSISDIILEDDYPTTGQLVVEHRKRYRGVSPQGRSYYKSFLESNVDGKAQRSKRSPDYMPRGFGSCCNGYGRSTSYGYSGYQPYNNDDFGYGSVRFVSRPYQGYRESGGYGYRNQEGQSYDDDDDMGEETSSNNRGLASYLTRGRGGDRMRDDKDSEENDNSRESKSSNNENRNNNGSDRSNSNRSNNRSNSGSRRNQNDNSSNSSYDNRGRGNSNRGGERRQQSYGRGSDSNDDEYSGYNSSNRNGGNNYDYVRNNNYNGAGRGGYGSSDYYGGYGGGSSGGYMGYNSGRYNNGGYNSGGYTGGMYGRNSGYSYGYDR